jgi:hypothetical protein
MSITRTTTQTKDVRVKGKGYQDDINVKDDDFRERQ